MSDFYYIQKEIIRICICVYLNVAAYAHNSHKYSRSLLLYDEYFLSDIIFLFDM